VRDRARFWWRALKWGAERLNNAAAWFSLAVLILGAAAGLTVRLVFHESLWLTAIVLLALLVLVMFEGTYRVWHVTDQDRVTAASERDAAKQEIQSRFSRLRYAFYLVDIDAQTRLRPDDNAIGNAEVTLRVGNTSTEDYLRCKMENITIVIDGQRLADDGDPVLSQGFPIISPRGHVLVRCPSVCGVPVHWQTGSVRFTVRYGHPSEPLQYRVTQEYELQNSPLHIFPGPGSQISTRLVTDSGVEDI
jgi:hypothetical protein